MTIASATSNVDTPLAGAAYPASTRLDSLDLLRGLCALAVAVFHFGTWGGFFVPSAVQGFLAICGTYGVSVFFVLSGFSLAHAYGHRFDDKIASDALIQYARRRIGRIAPLFAAVVIASLAGKLLSGAEIPDFYEVVANLTLVFGFADPAATPVIGGWSIGIEVVFYVIFPFLLLLHRHMVAVIVVSIFLTVWISASLYGMASLEQGWTLYVAPANHLIFFVAGTYAGLRLRQKGIPSSALPQIWVLAVMAIVITIALFFETTEIEAVTGFHRLILVPLSILLVVATSRIRLRRLSLLASLCGGASYPLYLIHPLMFFLATRFISPGLLNFGLVLLLAIGLAIIIDLLIDKPLQSRIKAAGW